MLRVAQEVSQLSTCRRNQVGCVLVDDGFEHIAIGYNGAYRGGPNDCPMPGQDPCGCLHAEVNAMVKTLLKPAMAFVTTSPCFRCASLLINAGVRECYVAEPHPNQAGVELLVKAGVRVIQYGSEL